MPLTTRATIKGLASGSPLIALHKWVGDLPDLQNLGETYRRPGGTGDGAQITGRAAAPMQIPVMAAFATAAEALSFKKNLEALQLKAATVVDPRNRTFPRVTVEHVVPVKIHDTSGAAAYRCESTLTILVQANGS